MRILILANNDGGLYRFRKNLIQELIKQNEILIALPYGEFVEPLKELGCHFFDTPLERRGMNPLKDAALFKQYRSIIRETKPDYVITYTIKPNIYGGLACRFAKVPYAVNITGLGTAFQGNGVLKWIVTTLYKVALKRANVVFFENEENRDIFVNLGIIDNVRTHVLHGAGVDIEEYELAEYPSDDKETRFLFMARVMAEKGVNELFSAMDKLVDEGVNCTLDVLGDFEENYRSEIERYEAKGWLKYHGYQKNVKPFIEKAHCFVLPSWHEGMANTNLESAAMGRPVITSNIHGCMEAVEEGVSGFLCEKQNADSLYQAMKSFTELSYEARKAMGIAGRKRMEEVFDKKKVVAETIQNISINGLMHGCRSET